MAGFLKTITIGSGTVLRCRCPVGRSLLLFIGVLSGAMQPAAAAGTAPNILLLMADDMNWRDCGAYQGLPGAYPPGSMPADLTPNMEALAAQGMRLDACFSATAMCAPLRQQLYTGIHPVRNGAYPNHGEVKSGTKSIVHHLSGLGYRVGLMGKRHIGPGASFPFEYLGSGTDTENAANIAAAEEFINRDADQPYCLVITSNSPHAPWDHGDHVADDTTLPIAADCVDTPEYRSRFNSYLGEVSAFDDEVGAWMSRVDAGPNPGNTMFICLTEQGAQFPGAKWTCYELGVRTGCLVRWPGQVAAGSQSDALIELIDVVPTLIDAAGGSSPTGIERLDGLSFLPVLIGGKTSHKPYIYGVQTTKEVNGQPDTGYAVRSIRDNRYKLIWNLQHDQVFAAGGATGQPFLSWMAVADDPVEDPAVRDHAKLIVDRYVNRPEWQFFDLQADPLELDDLIEVPAHSARIEMMKGRLEGWMREQRDRGIPTELAADKSQVPVADEVDPYHAWADLQGFVWLADRAAGADPDGDTRDNFTEWIDGSDPLVADVPGPSPILGLAVSRDGADQDVDLLLTRSRHHHGLGLGYEVRSTQVLGTPWQSRAATQIGWPEYLPDDRSELVSLRVSGVGVPATEFYQFQVSPTESIPGGPEVFFSGSTSPVGFGATQPLLNNRNLSITIRTGLPASPLDDGSGNDRAEVLWELAGGRGMSLVLMGDDIVFSGSSSTSAAGAFNLLGTLDPADFGRMITVRLSLEHKASATLFQLSYQVDQGSSFGTGVAIQPFTGYVGTANGGVGDYYAGNITGISGTPFGVLSTLAGGISGVSAWSSGAIEYEVAGYVGPAL